MIYVIPKEIVMQELWVSKSNNKMTFQPDRMVFDGLVPDLEKISEQKYNEEISKGNFTEKGNILFGNLKLGNMACGYVHYSEAYLLDKFEKTTLEE
jgi:hypothetical protein